MPAAKEMTIRLQTDMALGVEGDRVRARHVLKQGEQIYCSLSWAEELRRRPREPRRRQRAHSPASTASFWRGWLGRAPYTRPPLAGPPIQRSALAIKGLTYMPTGATVAALTTSLPETPGGERNWDYRYTWLRDSTFTLQALHYLTPRLGGGGVHLPRGLEPQFGRSPADHVRDRRSRATSTGQRARTSPATPGLVRCGSAMEPSTSARTTFTARRLPRSCCIPASVNGCRAGCADRAGPGRTRDKRLAQARPGHLGGSGQAAALCLLEADVLGGDGPRGLARGRSAATPSCEAAWPHTAEEIKTDILDHGLTQDGVLRQHYDTDVLDASNLLAALFGFLPAADERLRASVLAIADDLTEDGFVLRYRTGETDDGMSGKEGSFLICSFWLVSGLSIVSEQQRARDLMEKLLRVASPLGLYAEEFDTGTGRFLGNFPQAFSHLALIEAAGRIILSEFTGELSRDERPLRRDHHRQRRRWRHARAASGSLRQAHPPAGAR